MVKEVVEEIDEAEKLNVVEGIEEGIEEEDNELVLVDKDDNNGWIYSKAQVIPGWRGVDIPV